MRGSWQAEVPLNRGAKFRDEMALLRRGNRLFNLTSVPRWRKIRLDGSG